MLGELRLGFKLGSRAAENERELIDFLRHPVIEQLSVDGETSQIYADIVSDLRQRGKSVPTNDLWIAATAARAGAPVLTYDRHFEEIHRIGVRLLRAPD